MDQQKYTTDSRICEVNFTEDRNLNTRIQRALLNAGIITVSDLLYKSSDELISLNHIGRTMLEEIIKWTAANDFSLQKNKSRSKHYTGWYEQTAYVWEERRFTLVKELTLRYADVYFSGQLTIDDIIRCADELIRKMRER